MHILIDGHTLCLSHTAGKGMFTSNLLVGLSRLPATKKHTFWILAPSLQPPLDSLPSNWKWLSAPSGLLFYLYLCKLTISRKYAICLSPTSYITSLCSTIPTISIVYDLSAWKHGFAKNFKATILERLLLPLVLKKSCQLITISQSVRKELIATYPLIQNKLSVVYGSPNARHAGKVSLKIIRELGLTPHSYLVYVGTIEPRKNLITVVRAFALFQRALQNKTDSSKKLAVALPQLVIAGKLGWEYQPVLDAINKLNLHTQVKLLGYVPDEVVPSLYAYSAFLVYVPLYEGFGLPVVENMSLGKTAIVSKTPAVAEVIGAAGITVPAKDYRNIAQQMLILWKNHSLRNQLELEASNRRHHFSIEKQAKAMWQVIETVQI